MVVPKNHHLVHLVAGKVCFMGQPFTGPLGPSQLWLPFSYSMCNIGFWLCGCAFSLQMCLLGAALR